MLIFHRKTVNTMTIAVFFLCTFVILTSAQTHARPAVPVTTLPSGTLVKFLKISAINIPGKGKYTSIKVLLLKPSSQTDSHDRIADDCFRIALPTVLRMKKKKFALTLITKRTPKPSLSPLIKTYQDEFEIFFYKETEKNLWIPSGRAMPEWLKAPKPEKVKLSNGDELWKEKTSYIATPYSNQKSPITLIHSLKGFDKTTGRKPLLALIRRYATKKLTHLFQSYKMPIVNFFTENEKDGFYIRPLVTAFLLHDQGDKFWLSTGFKKAYFRKSKSFTLILTYQPTISAPQLPKNIPSSAALIKLTQNAEGLLKKHAKQMAQKLNCTSIAILANWSASKVGKKTVRYGIVFNQDKKGAWHRVSKSQ